MTSDQAHRAAYHLGRVTALAMDILLRSGAIRNRRNSEDRKIGLASTDPRATVEMLSEARGALHKLPAKRRQEYRERIGELVSKIQTWPGQLDAKAQSDWWLGYYHEWGRTKGQR